MTCKKQTQGLAARQSRRLRAPGVSLETRLRPFLSLERRARSSGRDGREATRFRSARRGSTAASSRIASNDTRVRAREKHLRDGASGGRSRRPRGRSLARARVRPRAVRAQREAHALDVRDREHVRPAADARALGEAQDGGEDQGRFDVTGSRWARAPPANATARCPRTRPPRPHRPPRRLPPRCLPRRARCLPARRSSPASRRRPRRRRARATSPRSSTPSTTTRTDVASIPADPGSSALAVAGSQTGVKAAFKKQHETSASLIPRLASKWPRPKWHAPWKLYRVISGTWGWVRSVHVDPRTSGSSPAPRTAPSRSGTSPGQLRLTLTGHIEQVTGLAVSDRHPYMFSCGLISR